jgi:protein ImuB
MSPTADLPTRVLVVWCPDWPVHAVGAGPDVPAAVLVGEGARATVLACSAAARAAGVRRGQRLRDAQRLCPDLRAYPRDEPAEERVFEPVVQAVENVAAGVEVVRPGLIALAAPGPARYHGGEPRLAMLVREAVADVGLTAPATPSGSRTHDAPPSGLQAHGHPTADPRAHDAAPSDDPPDDPLGCGVGIADGTFAASLAARLPVDEPLIVPPGRSAAFLARYPLRVLEHPELSATLQRLGIRTLGELAALPVADVANRFGPAGTQAHRLARGLDPRPPAARRPGEDLSALYLFDPPAERDEQVLFAAKALADRWRAGLAAAGVTCASVRIELATEGGGHHARTWRNGDALGSALSAQALAQRVRWQLDGWRTRTSGAATEAHLSSVAEIAADPLVSLRLVPGPLVIDTGSQQTLWGREAVPDRVGRAAERVQAMFGHDGVTLLHLTGGRDPAARIARTPWGEKPPADPAADPDAPWPGAVPEPAPPLVPDPERQPAVSLLGPDGAHIEVSGRVRLSARPAVLVLGGRPLPVTDWAGPWPYHEHPWRPAAVRRRARLQLSTADGRAFLLTLERGAWRVEGVYR